MGKKTGRVVVGTSAHRRRSPLGPARMDHIWLAARGAGSPAWRSGLSVRTVDAEPEFVQAWTALLEDEIQPAIRRYRDFVRKEYLSAARTVLAVIALPRGSECYRASFRLQTTIERRPEDTHALGKRVVERNEG